MKLREVFNKFARGAAMASGSHWAFLVAALVIIVWGITGPLFEFNNTWQLVINTGTTIVTFLMVFLIQNTQNRDSKAMHLKIDEIILSVKEARNRMIDLEEAPEEEVARLEAEFRNIRSSEPECGPDKAQARARAVEEHIKEDVEEILENSPARS